MKLLIPENAVSEERYDVSRLSEWAGAMKSRRLNYYPLQQHPYLPPVQLDSSYYRPSSGTGLIYLPNSYFTPDPTPAADNGNSGKIKNFFFRSSDTKHAVEPFARNWFFGKIFYRRNLVSRVFSQVRFV